MKLSSVQRLVGISLTSLFITVSLTACAPSEEEKSQLLATQATITCSVDNKKSMGSSKRRSYKLQTSCGELKIMREYILGVSKNDVKRLGRSIEEGVTYDFVTVKGERGLNVIDATLAEK